MTDRLSGHAPLSAWLISFVLSVQVLNNKYLHIAGPLTVGEVLSVALIAILVFSLSYFRTEDAPFSGRLAVVAFVTYWLGALGAVALSPVPSFSMNFLATVSIQLILFSSIIFFLRSNDVLLVLKWLGLFSALCGLINFWNSVPGASDFFQARQNPSRAIAGIELPFQRVVSFTNIYAQLGGLLVFGFFVLLGCLFREQKAVFSARTLGYLLLLCMVCLGVVALQSRATLVGFFVGIVLFSFFRCNAWSRVLGCIFIAVLAVIFWQSVLEMLESAYRMVASVQFSTVNARLAGYMDALELIGAHPFGIGQGAFGVLTEHSAVLHQTFLDAFLSTGWMGGTALCVAVLTPVFVLLPRALSRDALAAGFLSGYGSVFTILNFYTGLTEYFFWLLIPLGIVLGRFLDKRSFRNGTV